MNSRLPETAAAVVDHAVAYAIVATVIAALAAVVALAAGVKRPHVVGAVAWVVCMVAQVAVIGGGAQ